MSTSIAKNLIRVHAPARWHGVVIIAALAFAVSLVSAQSPTPLPSPTAPVNDYAGVMDPATMSALNTRLIQYQRTTGVEIAVAVVRTTGDTDIFEYSRDVARDWGIGSKGDDNPSLLLFVAIDDRKYFTQASRDLEDELPDVLLGSLQRQYLVPEFKQGNYAKGISDTIEAYIAAIDQRSSGTAASPTPVGSYSSDDAGSGSLFSVCICLGIIGIFILIIWASSGRGGGKTPKDRDRWGGGFGSGGAVPWIIGSIISGIGNSSGSSSSGDWGGGGGGGSDWGGFGGGGDFGGGGAGGSW